MFERFAAWRHLFYCGGLGGNTLSRLHSSDNGQTQSADRRHSDFVNSFCSNTSAQPESWNHLYFEYLVSWYLVFDWIFENSKPMVANFNALFVELVSDCFFW